MSKKNTAFNKLLDEIREHRDALRKEWQEEWRAELRETREDVHRMWEKAEKQWDGLMAEADDWGEKAAESTQDMRETLSNTAEELKRDYQGLREELREFYSFRRPADIEEADDDDDEDDDLA